MKKEGKKEDYFLDQSECQEEEKCAIKRVGEYRLYREVGRGAFATVYKSK